MDELNNVYQLLLLASRRCEYEYGDSHVAVSLALLRNRRDRGQRSISR